jgi:phosphoribosylformimino-5-aminoimidazole carboxamide ribotide isomerase
VIIGSIAVSNPGFAIEMIKKYGKKIVIGIDAKDGFVATHGWLETSETQAIELGKRFAEAGADTFIFTDIATDGTLSGPNLAAVTEMAQVTGKNVIASGGVSSLADLQAVNSAAVEGAIVGKALYENRFTLKQAMEAVKI